MHLARTATILVMLFLCTVSFSAVGDLLGTFPPEDSTDFPADMNFGSTLAVSGSTLFVGATRATEPGGKGCGLVYVLDISNPASVKVQRILAPPVPIGKQQFGASLAVSGSTLVVGAPGTNQPNVGYTGALFVFNWKTGALLDTLWPEPETDPTVRLGASVAFSGKILAAGKPYSSSGPAPYCGSVQFFNMRTGDDTKGFSSSVPANSAFGSALVASSKAIVASAPLDGTNASQAGSAEIFATSLNGPNFKLYSPKPGTTNRFGTALAIGGNYLYVGEPTGDFGAADAGTVYKYNLKTGALVWGLVNPLPGYVSLPDLFGSSIAATSTLVAVGSPREGDVHTGAVHLYNSKNVLVKTIFNPTPQEGEEFGMSVAFGSSSKVIVGAPHAYRGSAKTGAVYFFSGK